MDNKLRIIKEAYYNPETGFQSASALHKKLRGQGISLDSIKNFIKKQEANQINEPYKRDAKQFNQILAPEKFGMLQIDLLDMSNYATRNNGYRYVLHVVDTYTRFAFVEALRNKDAKTVLTAMKKIERTIKGENKSIYSMVMDEGSEFNNKQWNTHFAYVKHVFRKDPDNHTTTAIVERRNGTFRRLLQKYFSAYKTLRWFDVIQRLNDNLNNSYHRTIKHSPQEIFDGEAKNEQKIREKPTQYAVGDRVRLLLNRNVFTKGTLGRYSETVYAIEERVGLGYTLENRNGKVFGWQLKKVDGDVEQAPDLPVVSRPIQVQQAEQVKANRKKRKINQVNNELENTLAPKRPKNKALRALETTFIRN